MSTLDRAIEILSVPYVRSPYNEQSITFSSDDQNLCTPSILDALKISGFPYFEGGFRTERGKRKYYMTLRLGR
jgi:hypothetical protein